MVRHLPLWFLRISSSAFLFSMGVAARLPGGQHFRFIILPDWCKRAVAQGNNVRATTLALELLDLASCYPDDWNYGNAIHHGHLVLGRVALANGDGATARAELLAAGPTPGSPQLDSFGPNYFEHCRRFWTMGETSLANWTDDINCGRAPNFGPNLNY